MNKLALITIVLACVEISACDIQNHPKDQPTGIDSPNLGAYLKKDVLVDYSRAGDYFSKKLTATAFTVEAPTGTDRTLYSEEYQLDVAKNIFNRRYYDAIFPIAALDLSTGKFVSPWPPIVSIGSNANYRENTDGSITYFNDALTTRARLVITAAEDLQGASVNQIIGDLGAEASKQQVSKIATGSITLRFSEGAQRFKVTKTVLEDRYLIFKPLSYYTTNQAEVFSSLDELMPDNRSGFKVGETYWRQWWISEWFGCNINVGSVAPDRRSGTLEYYEAMVANIANANSAESAIGFYPDGFVGTGTWQRIPDHGKDMIVFNDIPEACVPAEIKTSQPFIAINDLDGKVSLGIKIPQGGVYSTSKYGSVWSYNAKAASDIDRLITLQSMHFPSSGQ